MDREWLDRARGVVVGAAVGDALGMPLEFGPPQPPHELVREMGSGRLPPGSFTDDTEMALAVAECLLGNGDQGRLDPEDLAERFVDWLRRGPPDVGLHTRNVLSQVAGGRGWQEAVSEVQRREPDSAGNGSVMRCWPVALARAHDLPALLHDSRLQSRVTHPHEDCQAGSAFVNACIYHLLRGSDTRAAIMLSLDAVGIYAALREVIESAERRQRSDLCNSGWVRHTLESAVWGLLTTTSFEEAVVQVANLGSDADTAASVAGALAGAAYGLSGIPEPWKQALHGEWPLHSGKVLRLSDFAGLADRLCALSAA
jgi:ADP-ribosyl-[dinitrogen reductase] hydrolase